MKKVLFMVVLLPAVLGACNQGQSRDYGRGGNNACEYVRENTDLDREDIASVDVVGEDSLLGDSWLANDAYMFANATLRYLQGTMSVYDYASIVGDRLMMLHDVVDSWDYGGVVNDSLRCLPKYDNVWRLVYVVRVTMKSQTSRDIRVLMDKDGVRPRMTEEEFMGELDRYNGEIMDGYQLLR